MKTNNWSKILPKLKSNEKLKIKILIFYYIFLFLKYV